jgi:hypothetical protein
LFTLLLKGRAAWHLARGICREEARAQALAALGRLRAATRGANDAALVLTVRNDRKLSTHERCAAQLGLRQFAPSVAQPAPAEVVAVHNGDAVPMPGIAIVIDNVDAVVNDDRRIAAVAASPKA